jgi:hypothetical protein
MPIHWKMAFITGTTWALVLGANQMNVLLNPLVLFGIYAYFIGSVWLMCRSIAAARATARNFWATPGTRTVGRRQMSVSPLAQTFSQWKDAWVAKFHSGKIFPTKAARAERAFQEARAKIAETRAMCRDLTEARCHEALTVEHLRTIDNMLANILRAIEEDPGKRSIVPTLISDYLVPTMKCLSLYQLLLARNLTSAREVLEETEHDTLSFLAAKFMCLYEQLHAGEIAQLATVRSELELARKVEVVIPAEAVAVGR